MVGKLAAIFVAHVVLACSMITTEAFVYKSMHRAPKSPIAGKRIRWESSKGKSDDPIKSEDTAKADA